MRMTKEKNHDRKIVLLTKILVIERSGFDQNCRKNG